MLDWRQFVRQNLPLSQLKPQVQHQVVEELAGHLEDKFDDSLQQGKSAAEAVNSATHLFADWQELGANIHSSPPPPGVNSEDRNRVSQRGAAKESKTMFFQELMQDLRYGARLLARRPGFTAIIVLTLALGIGANSAIFSVLRNAFLRPLPVHQPQQLVYLYSSGDSLLSHSPSSYPVLRYIQENNEVFTGLAAHSYALASFDRPEGSEMITGEIVTGNYFQTLGVTALEGRTFTEADDRAPDSHYIVVISEGMWERRLGSDPSVVGSTIRLNGDSYEIVGIMPEWFNGALKFLAPDFWVPMMMQQKILPGRNLLDSPGSGWLQSIARLRPGIDIDDAEANVKVLFEQLRQDDPESMDEDRPILVAANDVLINPDFDTAIVGVAGVLFLVTGFVLLIACANVANLLLSRATRRRKEIATRLSLGARRGRLVRQLLTESLLLAFLGGVFATLVAWAGDRFFAAKLGNLTLTLPIQFSYESHLDGSILLFTLLIALLTGVIFGMAPALQSSRTNLAATLKDASGTLSGGKSRGRLANTFVIVQVAASIFLLVTAGLFLRSLANAAQVDLGLDPAAVLTAGLSPNLRGYSNEESKVFLRTVVERVEALPEVESATIASHLPLTLTIISESTIQEGKEDIPFDDWPSIDLAHVGPRYFHTVSMPLVRGREFLPSDSTDAPPVAIVNLTLARQFWPDLNPIGKRLRFESDEQVLVTVVGVVRDSKYRTLGEQPRPYLYRPIQQTDMPFPTRTLLVRCRQDQERLAAEIRPLIRSIDPAMPVFSIQGMEEALSTALLLPRSGATLFGLLGFLGLLLAAIGIFGVISFSVSQRIHEIGIRMALGAGSSSISGMVIGQGMRLALIGSAVGLLSAWGIARFLEAFLYGISPSDPLTYGAITLILLAAAWLACLMPTRKALRVDPMVALRYE